MNNLKLLLPVLLVSAACTTDTPVTGEPHEPVTFTVHIQNVSNDLPLITSDGKSHPVPLSPGVWAVYNSSAANPIFTKNSKASTGLERQAEDGNPAILSEELKANKDIIQSGTFTTPIGSGSTEAAPAGPGKLFEITFKASPGAKFNFATMFAESNDLFYSADENGIALFNEEGEPLELDITSNLHLWDAGTEVNQEPGLGSNQAPRQSAANTGPADDSIVKLISEVGDGFNYPATDKVIRVTISNDDKHEH